jgi:broad specificity phosphatase PhoE
MPRLLLVRHGRAAAGFHEDHDPGLDAVGREQAAAVAVELAPQGPMALLSSPLRRARETAQPLEAAWEIGATVLDPVGEIPSPFSRDDLGGRGDWLRDVMSRSWPELDATLDRWRADLLDALLGTRADTVFCTHFVAINAAVGAALGDDRVLVFKPDNCSVTELDVVDGRLVLVSRGHEAATTVR